MVSFDKDWYEARWGASPASKGTVTGNLYTGQVGYDFITEEGKRARYSGDSQFYGWTIADTLSYRKWDVTIGAHKHTARVYSASSKIKTVTDAVSPLFAIVYKPSRNWSVLEVTQKALIKELLSETLMPTRAISLIRQKQNPMNWESSTPMEISSLNCLILTLSKTPNWNRSQTEIHIYE